MKGWIKLNRSISEHWIWSMDKPFDRLHAWVDILLSVNHTEQKIPLNKNIITIEKGAMITSERKLAERWGWSRTKVTDFLKTLENDCMVDIKKLRAGTYLKVLTYEDYGESQSFKKAVEEPLKSLQETTRKPQKSLNKNYKNDNNDNNYNNIYTCEKIHFADNVTMTNDEYKSLIESVGEDKAKRAVLKLDNYKGSKGKEYKSDYRAILSWVIKALDEEDRTNKPSGFSLLKTEETQEEFERIMWERMQREKENS